VLPEKQIKDHGVAPVSTDDAENSEEAARIGKLAALTTVLTGYRKEAIDARISQGIDQQWEEDIEFYEGIDDANRHEMTGALGAYTSKPVGQTAITSESSGEDAQSTVFVNITRPYCDAAAAKMGDMLMPTDDRAFLIKPTPIPDLENTATGKFSLDLKQSILDQIPKEMAPQEAQASAEAMLAKAKQKATTIMEEAKQRSNKAQDQIDDWFVETKYHKEVRSVLDSSVKIGTGVLKGPIPTKIKVQKVIRNDAGEFELIEKEEIKPKSKCIDPRNLFPDGSCGDDIHNGSYIWERDNLSRRKVEDLLGTPGYIDSQLKEVLKEGPKTVSTALEADRDSNTDTNKNRFEVWYYTGRIAAEDMEALGCKCEENERINAVVTMINDRIVKAARSHLDTSDFPYDVMVWQEVKGRWAGMGVSRQIRTPQRIVNSATRNLMDNAGLSSGPQIIIHTGVLEPVDGNYNIHARKIWYIDEEADIKRAKDAMEVINIDSRQQELMAIIDFGMKLAEEVTGLPLLMQGQKGDSPDTLGGQQLVNNNASTVLRRQAKLYDDSITVPHVGRYYIWIMQYGKDSEKGDYMIDARGSSALVERDIQNQAIINMGAVVKDPSFGIDPKKWIKQYFRSQRLDPKDFQYSKEDQQKIDEQPGPTDPRIEVANIRAELEQNLAQLRETSSQQITEFEKRFEEQENEKDRALEAWIASLQDEGQKKISLDELKTKLADTSMKLRTQRELSLVKTSQTMKPPSEPTGRAPNGRAFEK